VKKRRLEGHKKKGPGRLGAGGETAARGKRRKEKLKETLLAATNQKGGWGARAFKEGKVVRIPLWPGTVGN